MAKRDVLKEIVQKKKERLLLAKEQLPQAELEAKLTGLPATRPFLEALNKPRTISLIAEIKKASPSRGVIRPDLNIQEVAGIYQEAGVQAVSVLTEEDYFQGSLSYINEVKSIVEAPVLRKDFILEPYQVFESRYYGADAILLIADLLSKDTIFECMAIAEKLGMDCLVEAHEEKELKKIVGMKCPIIGINNRNLHTLEVDLKTTEKLYLLIPRGTVVVVESGIKSRSDVSFLKILGVNAILVGEALMEAPNIREKIDEIMAW